MYKPTLAHLGRDMDQVHQCSKTHMHSHYLAYIQIPPTSVEPCQLKSATLPSQPGPVRGKLGPFSQKPQFASFLKMHVPTTLSMDLESLSHLLLQFGPLSLKEKNKINKGKSDTPFFIIYPLHLVPF